MSRLRAAARDVRALGLGAPLRVAYDGSKALGGHTLAFEAALRRVPTTARSTPVYRLPDPPAAAVARARDEADEIADGVVTLFGRRVEVGDEPDWHASYDPEAPGVRWPEGPWWQIDVRLAGRLADIKWVWELGRHRHLVVLARALASQDPDPRWATTLQRHFRSWLHHNPLEQGVHWASNLEVALRAMAWLEVLQRAGHHLDPALRQDVDTHLYHSGNHLLLELPYTVSTMRNNHLIGDAVGLVTLARAFPDEPAARRWAQAGEGLLRSQLDREIRPDGSMVEDSVSYHRFVIELLCRLALLGDPSSPVVAALHRSARFLDRLGVHDGPVPHHGDWDEGRAVATSGDPLDLSGSARLALAIVGEGAPDLWRTEHDELAWYARTGTPAAGDPVEVDGHSIGGGISRAEREGLVVWCKGGGGPWHGHADHTTVAVRLGDEWLVGDPGTGNYNGRDESRSFLRSSAAHAVLILDGEDQLVPHRAFRWAHTATGRVGAPLDLPGARVLWCAHDAYRRCSPSRRIARVVVVAEDGSGLVVADWVEGPPGQEWQLALPGAPASRWVDGRLSTADGTTAHLAFLTEGVTTEVEEGMWSSTYGAVEPAPRLLARGTVGGPVAWALRVEPAGPTSDATVHGDLLRVAGATVTISWLDGAVALVVDHPDRPGAPTREVALR